MDNYTPELREKIRQQFDTGPYPRQPVEASPKNDYDSLFIHNIVTAFYLRDKKVITPENKVILDAGCGSGYKALALAIANPGARIIGIDLSQESVKLAKQRLDYHGFPNAEFYVMPIEDLPSLGLKFDYINNDEVLYLFPDPAMGLKAMKAVLKPEGIIRSNLHSFLGRYYYYRAQDIFKMMGLMDDNPGELEISIVRDTMKALKDGVDIKRSTWQEQEQDNPEYYMMNYLFQGDKGYTIPQMFAALRAADLEFVSMVNWRGWQLQDLFINPEDLPAFMAMSLPELSPEEELHLFELLHPCHRLLDFWCADPKTEESTPSVSEWTEADWQNAWVELHPQLQTPQVREDLLESIANRLPFQISQYITLTSLRPIGLESSLAACLLPLWERRQSIKSLTERWIQIRPVDPVTLEPVTEIIAFEQVKSLVRDMEAFLYLLLERSA
ncbi:class I SAM-dependent methyltransferase [Laspinema olomoucense]|uniref:class I SAM-dependent methyltransferase n=1 Tax=Laspinema olomoucense TaxID=3231600 RepID=UPI0021BB65C8|nr:MULTISPECIES: class I SAM-dependent methyltransferase [unclassified Laspinema]MCT7989226.1 class I SAM-dependent methyltransferase [Laspinema sp. D3a]MCT7992600.1 class I SAM-dependent methyltransferase [Laspinema sp. D3c]